MMNWYYTILGGHTHVRVFMNGGKCGDLVFRNDEFQDLMRRESDITTPGGPIKFIPEDHPPAIIYKPGDVFQITEAHGRAGWIGNFVMATEIKGWGIIGFVNWPEEHEENAKTFIRLNWKDIAPIGRAVMIPADLSGQTADDTVAAPDP